MVLFRIIRNLLRLAINLALLPIALLSRNFFGIIILIGLGYVASTYIKNDAKIRQESGEIAAPGSKASTAPSAIPTVAPTAKGNVPPAPEIVDPVRVQENGNSAFSTDIMKQMLASESIYYSRVFYWAMDTLKPGQTRDWASHNIAGTFTITDSFLNKRNMQCRRFKEILKVHAIQQTLDGMACQREGGGWCKLRPEATPACGLGGSSGILDGIGRLF
jgi:surface antigen